MTIKIALAGNPNSGKTTLFNSLTGKRQYVGNWPGVTVEKKEGKVKGYDEVILQDLPGIYSLSPYTLEEVVARNYLVNDRPDVIINIIDATNIERNLYLTTQIMELGIPVILALNMMDVVKKNGDLIYVDKLEKLFNCEVVLMSALKNEGSDELIQKAIALGNSKEPAKITPIFQGSVEHAIAHIEESIQDFIPAILVRWTAIKIFERDQEVLNNLNLKPELLAHLEEHIQECEQQLDDDAESIIINQRYCFITDNIAKCIKKKALGHLTVSDKIDRIITNRWLALPIFALVIFMIYYISVTTLGSYLTDFVNEKIVAELIIHNLDNLFTQWAIADWLHGLILEGIVAGVGAVIGFVPQIVLVSFFLSLLEDVGYMARIAFILDRIFRKFGLSGKSFIPMLVGSGCGIPGVMASRTIESEADRKMTIMTTTFIPCTAKLPIIALVAGALFNGVWWVSPSAYFLGIIAIVISGIILKKTKRFAAKPAPFVLELPAYHIPFMKNVFLATYERGSSFVKRAVTVILLASVALWFLTNFGYQDGLVMVQDNSESLLAAIGNFVAIIFVPLGFGKWQAVVGTITGLIAKENVVSTLGVLYGFAQTSDAGANYWPLFAQDFTMASGYAFLAFNLLCAPCFAAVAAIRKEMNDRSWTVFALTYQTLFAYLIAFIIYQIGTLIQTQEFTLFTGIAFLVIALLIYLLGRKNPYES